MNDFECLICGSTTTDMYPESMWCVSCVGKTLLQQTHEAADFAQDREVIERGVGRRFLK